MGLKDRYYHWLYGNDYNAIVAEFTIFGAMIVCVLMGYIMGRLG